MHSITPAFSSSLVALHWPALRRGVLHTPRQRGPRRIVGRALTCGLVGDAGSLLHSGNPLSAAQQWRRPSYLDGPTSGERDGNRRHRGVICGLHDHGDVVLSEGVTAADDLDASGLGQLLPHDLQAVLGVLHLRRQRLGGIGELIQVLWHRGPPLVDYSSASLTILRNGSRGNRGLRHA